MKQYHDLLKYIQATGHQKGDRTGTGTLSIFGYQMRFDLSQGFPLVTTKKVHFKSIALELLWFLQGNTNNNWLKERGVSIWNEWAGPDGELGPIYGHQWRAWQGVEGKVVDQITNLVHAIKTDPNSRRLIVSAWNPAQIPEMALAPCHTLFQFYVENSKLSCQLYQRSADVFLGVPFNIASYALLTHLMADQCDLEVGEFIWSGGDCHIYNNHQEQVTTLLSRICYDLPKLLLARKPASIFDYRLEDFQVVGYEAHPSIKAVVAV